MGVVIYRSSAGSGKTFTLVSQFLIKTIEKPWLYKRILAITFTNKATEELKTRIIRELDHLASGAESDYLDVLSLNLPTIETETLRKNAAMVLERIVHDYSSFSVSTIDSYFQMLARTLTREMKLPMKYAIELDTESICRNVTELLLSDAGKNHGITEWLESLLLHQIDNGKSWNIRPELEKMTRQLLNSDDARAHSDESNPGHILQLIGWMDITKKSIENSMRNYGEIFLDTINKYGFEPDDFSNKMKGPAGYFYKLASNKSGKKEFGNINSYTQKALDDPDNFLSKDKRKNKQLLDLVHQEIHPLLKASVEFYHTKKSIYISILECLKLIWQSGISGSLDLKLKAYREEQQLFHLSDTTRMLSQSVKDQDTPFIYEKSGNTYFHLFIDEFQDTGLEQWNILRPLVINSLSSGNEVMIVGDAKQSIYRWRGGDMALIVDQVKNEILRVGYQVSEKDLNTNWRSARSIVEFNNSFFPFVAEQESHRFGKGNDIFAKAYSTGHVFQHTKNGAIEGLVELKFFPTEKDQESGETSHWKTKALTELQYQIESLISEGYSYGDIAILVRTNSHENEIAEFLFKGQKIPFISSNSLLLSKNETIQLLLSCFRILVKPEESLFHAEVQLRMHRELLEDKIPFNKKHLIESADAWTVRFILEKKEQLKSSPLFFVYHYFLDCLQLRKTDPFVQKFSDLIMDYIASGGHSTQGFLLWWDEHVSSRKWSVELSDAGKSVKILTIHRSKGLEFPVVFIPFLDWSLYPSDKSILWVKGREEKFNEFGKLPVYGVDDLADSAFREDFYLETLNTSIDNLNLLYVAFTRPENKLFVYGPSKPEEKDVANLVMRSLALHPELSSKFVAGDYPALRIGQMSPKESNKIKNKKDPFFFPETALEETSITANTPENGLQMLKLSPYKSTDEIMIGDFIHSVLSELKNAQDKDRILKTRIEGNPSDLVQSNKNLIQSGVNNVQALMESRGWLSEQFKVVNEQDICDENGNIYRPDRILFGNQETIVIDFKTGSPSDKHPVQVKEYCRILKDSGLPNVSGHLIYTKNAELVTVA